VRASQQQIQSALSGIRRSRFLAGFTSQIRSPLSSPLVWTTGQDRPGSSVALSPDTSGLHTRDRRHNSQFLLMRAKCSKAGAKKSKIPSLCNAVARSIPGPISFENLFFAHAGFYPRPAVINGPCARAPLFIPYGRGAL